MIVSYSYYTDTFYGLTLDETDYPQYNAWAERMVAAVCRGRVTEMNISSLSETVQTAYKNAVCAQISYFVTFGLETAIAGLSGESFTVGKVSVNSGSRFPIGKSSMLCPAALSYLEQTNLMNPSVGTQDAPFLPFWFGNGGWY